jgi:two-component system sensor histidine kinase PilS (NtrC family)
VAPGLGALLRRSLEEHTPLSRYKTVARRNGRDVTLGISTTILDREEDRPSVTAIFQDITDQERLEAVNRRAERLEAVAELSASLAHEIKNPLASIRSAVEQLTRSSLRSDDRDVLQRLVVSESERLSRLLSEFIEFSRVRIGQVEQVNFTALVRDCLAVVRQHPVAQGEIEIVERGLDVPLHIPGDSDLLHRAVFNLVLNAVQFSPRPGRVEVQVTAEADRMGATELGISDPVRFSVRDSGPGIADEDMGRIFDPFFTTRKGGSGLGLAMVHRAVEAHEGAVFVDRSPEGGTEFTLYLPGTGEDAQGGES